MKALCKTVLTGSLLVLGLAVSVNAAADVVLGSWNIKHAGWGEKKRFDQLAHVKQAFDLVSLQEIMDLESVERLERELEAITGDPWESMASHLIGRSTYQEAYAFLWNETTMEYLDGAVVFLDQQDVFSREPYSARFRSTLSNDVFAIGNIHVLYGDSVSDRLPEIDALADYWQWLGEIYPNTPRLLMGDMNLDGDHDGWDAIRDLGAVPVVNDGETTLSTSDGRYANQYDHIWATPDVLDISSSGKIRFPEMLGIDHETARATVSDHAPIWVAIGDAELVLSQAIQATSSMPAQAANDEATTVSI